VYLNVIPERI